MMRFITLLVMCCLLSACLPVYHTEHQFLQPTSERGKQCVAKCMESRAICNRYCKAPSQSLCEHEERERARIKFNAYVKEMKSRGKPIYKNERSFFDPSYCRFVNRETHDCNCEEEFRACYRMCGGKVIEKTICVTNCG